MALPAAPGVTVKTGTQCICLPSSEFLRNPMVPKINTLETTGDTCSPHTNKYKDLCCFNYWFWGSSPNRPSTFSWHMCYWPSLSNSLIFQQMLASELYAKDKPNWWWSMPSIDISVKWAVYDRILIIRCYFIPANTTANQECRHLPSDF